jgi:hypothetical protein
VEELLEQETKSKLPEVPEGITIAKKLEESTSEVLVEANKVLVET